MFSFLPKWHDSEAALGFVPEWLAVAALGLLDILLIPRSGIHFTVTGHDGYFLIPILFVIALVTRKLGGQRAGFIIEFLALMLAAAQALAVPVFGGHYLVDMVAGAGVFVFALAVVRWAPLPRAISFAQMATAD